MYILDQRHWRNFWTVDLVIVRFSKIPKGFVSTQPIVIKLYTDICDHITHSSNVSDFKVT